MAIHSAKYAAALLAVFLVGWAGCDRAGEQAPGGGAGDGAVKAEPGYFTGRVTRADGSPITLAGVKYKVTINGVTAVGENNAFHPPVAADGTFRLKLPQGLFHPPFATITFPFEGKTYTADLEPVDPVEGTRDGAGGIRQLFVWRTTGPRPSALNPDVNNHTHWYGISLSVLYPTYRDDIQKSILPPPDGTRVVFTFKPTSATLIDGTEAKTVTVERKWKGGVMASMDALNDLPPTNYEVSAAATLPDGSAGRALVHDFEEKKYKPSAKFVLQPYANGNSVVVVPTMLHWVLE